MMRQTRRALPAAAIAAALGTAVFAGIGGASPAHPADLESVAAPNHATAGLWSPNGLSPGLTETAVAEGADRLDGGTPEIPYYGYLGDGPLVPALGDTQTPTHNVEATKTEPDKNTYLVLQGQTGADPGYDYGTHFVFQGHEAAGYVTRINLDADTAHRVTLMASTEADGKSLPVFDGSTWDPWAHRLLLTSEEKETGGVWSATVGYPSRVRDISGALGRGGYEGIQNDSAGNLWIVEDIGGKAGTRYPHAKQPNSFVYRFVPRRRGELTQGRLQALQVISSRTGEPIGFQSGDVDGDIASAATRELHTYGHTLETRWVTLHDTRTDGDDPFDANVLAKQRGATPFKRPENGQFAPGSGFTRFYFDETGDTNALTEAGSDLGGFGGVQELTQDSPSSNRGELRLLYQGDVDHTGFDNVTFLSRTKVAWAEDRGDTLHRQHDALDSAWVLDTREDYADPAAAPPVRMLAEGRDVSATLDSPLLSKSDDNGFQNDGDNEITGIHVSDGDPGRLGILGARIPHPWQGSGSRGWRVFYTQQHGENRTWEIVRKR